MARVDDPVIADESARVDDADDGPQTLSDESMQRLLRGVMLAMAAVVVIGLFAGAAIWALQGDDEPPPPMNAVDVGFLQDMITHHEQALLISELYLANHPDGGAAPYAREVIMFQERDLEWMRGWLAEEGYPEGEPDRIAMEWMDEPTPVAEMRGMQSQERLDLLTAADDSDRGATLFFVLMIDHHDGGVHMAEHARDNGQRPDIIDFAATVARNQQVETIEYEMAMERLGLL